MTPTAEAERPPAAMPSTTLPSLAEMNRRFGWSLDEAELSAIAAHFKKLRREPLRAELETIAQTWSEHCKHKTFTSPILFTEGRRTRRIANLLKETIMDATARLKKPWCLSVFKDNAGIIRFDDKWALAFKVETHNHPCALEPYGGATTGVGGVVRDILGAGLGAKPVLNTDVFCLCAPTYAGALPEGTLHPRRTLGAVVAGVRDYGNRMGIPTAGGALWFDEGYKLNPLVFCGTVGLLPTWAVSKQVRPGDLIVAAGGRTGKDGLHGATFSSTSLGESASASAVQIGHAINEKRLLDALLAARDRRLYRAVTDCGAGGFSSAIGELGAKCGAKVQLEKAPLKAADLEPWEAWLSESQERMVFAVPPKNLKAFLEVFQAEGCEAAVLGEFTSDRRLRVSCRGETVTDLDMVFLHDGLPRQERTAAWEPPKPVNGNGSARKVTSSAQGRYQAVLTDLLGHFNVCSRAWIIRQYDHEVQAGTMIKPLQGAEHDGPGDACVIWPHAATGETERFRGFAVSHGLNPEYGKIDPYYMALACADEALRNLACVGADVSKAAFLDNFCWGDTQDPVVLGGLVRAALGCRDAALALDVPFISGKDSLNNATKGVSIPGTLLISAVAPVADVRKGVTMDFKAPNNAVYLLGRTSGALGGSLFAAWAGHGGNCGLPLPPIDLKATKTALRRLSTATAQGLVSSCHDLSEGGLAVAAAEMAFAGGFGASLDLDLALKGREVQEDAAVLFSESTGRILVEVAPEKEKAFLRAMKGAPLARIGDTTANPVLRFIGLHGSPVMEAPLAALKAAWLRTLPAALQGGKS